MRFAHTLSLALCLRYINFEFWLLHHIVCVLCDWSGWVIGVQFKSALKLIKKGLERVTARVAVTIHLLWWCFLNYICIWRLKDFIRVSVVFSLKKLIGDTIHTYTLSQCRMPNQIRTLNFNDTFLDFEHLKSCFPQYSVKVSLYRLMLHHYWWGLVSILYNFTTITRTIQVSQFLVFVNFQCTTDNPAEQIPPFK